MIRKWLIDLREKQGKSQEEVAEDAGITRQYYGMIESGDRNPSVSVAKSIADTLNFEWTLFFEEKSNETLLNSTA